jgi:hypothetical protein
MRGDEPFVNQYAKFNSSLAAFAIFTPLNWSMTDPARLQGARQLNTGFHRTPRRRQVLGTSLLAAAILTGQPLVLAAGGMAMTRGGESNTVIALDCDLTQAPDLQPLCPALLAELQATAGAETLVAATADVGGDRRIRFELLERAVWGFRGRLVWQGGDVPVAGPEVSLRISDAAIDEQALRRYAETLVRQSDLPL